MICSIDGCDKPHLARGWCITHYTRWRRHGDPLHERQRPSFAERFWSYVDKSGPCWLWTGGVNSVGYGVFSWRENGKVKSDGAHRIAYELTLGPIPAGLHLDHVKVRGCTSTACCNPAHLEPVTPRENTLRGVGPSALNALKTHCKHGHEFTPENTWVNPKTSTRRCRECSRRLTRESAARRQTAAKGLREAA